MKTIGPYLELTKPRILLMVLVTTTLGFFLGERGVHHFSAFLFTLLGMASATGGAATLNNYLERDSDAKMARTRSRALPAGLIEPHKALTAGVGLVLFGVLLLACAVNLLTAFLVLLAVALRFARNHTPLDARRLLKASVLYLPLLLLLILLDAHR